MHHKEIYGLSYGVWPYAYQCTSCKAHVGVHPSTNLPLGTLADHALRESRIASKDLFQRVLKVRGLSRTRGYQWLASGMEIPKESCHFGWFELKDCERAKSICENELMECSPMGKAFASAWISRSRN